MDVSLLQNTVVLLGLGFGAGILHAFDADHVVAVSALYSKEEKGSRRLLDACSIGMMWALGHGVTLLLVTVLVILAGINLPDGFFSAAETLVGVLLVVIGVGVLFNLFRSNVRFSLHRHDGKVAHAHFHRDSSEAHTRKGNHSPVFVGMIHGAAGSAPILALLPALTQGSWVAAMVYVVLFSVAVGLAMSLFGGLLVRGVSLLQDQLTSLVLPVHAALGLMSISLGIFWLQI